MPASSAMMQFTRLPEPRWLILGGIILLGLLALSYGFARGRSRPWVRTLCGLLRLTAITGLVLCLLDPQWIEKTVHPRRTRFAVLVDTSRSMATTDVPGRHRRLPVTIVTPGYHGAV